MVVQGFEVERQIQEQLRRGKARLEQEKTRKERTNRTRKEGVGWPVDGGGVRSQQRPRVKG